MSDNDNDRHGRKPLPRRPADAQLDKSSRSLPEIDSLRIHRDAEEARVALAQRLAAAASSDPSALTPEKLSRLGRTGLAALVEALRSSLPEPVSLRNAKPARTAKPHASSVKLSRGFTRLSGWWDDPPPSSGLAPALMRGLLLGAFLDLVAVAGLLAAGF